jgi:hypothetical protein
MGVVAPLTGQTGAFVAVVLVVALGPRPKRPPTAAPAPAPARSGDGASATGGRAPRRLKVLSPTMVANGTGRRNLAMTSYWQTGLS